MSISPMKLAFYKGVSGKYGAIQFQFKQPHYYCPVCKNKDFESVLPKSCSGTRDRNHESVEMQSREGCIFMEITSAIGPNKYDWDNKINLAFSVHDMSKLLMALETGAELNIQHDPGQKSDKQGKIVKSLYINCPQGKETGFFFTCSEKNADLQKTTQHKVGLNGPEALGLVVFLRSAIPRSLNW
jgi:hypothetical protein